jgi:Peptidase A4 family
MGGVEWERRRRRWAALVATVISVGGLVTFGGPVAHAAGPTCSTPSAQAQPSPPPRLSPLAMTPDQRRHSGFPEAPPVDSDRYRDWHEAMSHATAWVAPSFACSEVTAGPGHQAGGGTGAGSGVSADHTYANWSGYENTQGPFHGIQGHFQLPYTTGDGFGRFAAIWLGVGQGSNTDQLVQAGVEEDTSAGTGSATLYSWYEIYPKDPYEVIVSLPVNQGDNYYVSISAGSSNSFFMENESSGQYTSFTASEDHCSCVSTEAIEERPTVGGALHPLTILPRLDFWNIQSVTNSGTYWMGALPGGADTMVDDNGNLLAQPCCLSNGDLTIQQPGFSMDASPGSLSLAPLSSGTTTIGVYGNNLFNQTVSLSVSAPAADSASISPASVFVSPNGTAYATLYVSRGIDVSTFQVTVTGTSATFLHASTAVTVNLAL